MSELTDIAFVDTCNVWSIGAGAARDDGSADDATRTLVYENVACMYDPTTNFDKLTAIGQVKETNIMTSDHFYFESGLRIITNYEIQLTTPSRAQCGQWFSVRGIPQTLDHPLIPGCGVQMVFATRTNQPEVS